MNKEKKLHEMSIEQLGELFPIIISDPSEKWPQIYQAERKLILESIPEAYIERIDHIGSTAVPDLKAKPTIDILLQVSKNSNANEIITAFKNLGYHYTEQPDNPPPHMMFVKGYTEQGFKGQAYHVHVRYKGDWNEIYFRDYLIKHKNIAKEYEELKLKLAAKYKNNREEYTNAKTDFIEKVNRLAKMNNAQKSISCS